MCNFSLLSVALGAGGLLGQTTRPFLEQINWSLFAWRGGQVLLILILAMGAYRGCVRGLRLLHSRQKLSYALLMIARRILRWTIAVLALLFMLQVVGVLEYTWAATTTILGLIAVGFIAVWSVLSNSLCAILLIVNQPFAIGDWIHLPGEAGDIQGEVVDFNLIYTCLRARDGGSIQVPNNLFFQRPIKSRRGEGTASLDEHLMAKGETPTAA